MEIETGRRRSNFHIPKTSKEKLLSIYSDKCFYFALPDSDDSAAKFQKQRYLLYIQMSNPTMLDAGMKAVVVSPRIFKGKKKERADVGAG